MKKTILALTLAAAAAFAVNVSAEEAAAPAALEEISPVILDGYRFIKVTSSDSEIPGTNVKPDSTVLFDHNAETGCTIEFVDEEKAAQIAEETSAEIPVASEKTLSVYTSSGTPHKLRALSLLMEGDLGTVVSFNVYGTNDSLLLDWTQLSFTAMKGNTDSGYHVFEIANPEEKYVFYRIDFHLENGSSFTVNEIGLYKSEGDIFEYSYAYQDVIEAGETPEIIRTRPEEPEVIKNVPKFGFGFPGAVRPVPYK